MNLSGRTPFLEKPHEALAERVHAIGEKRLRATASDESDPAGQTRSLAAAFGDAGLLAHAVPPPFGSMDLRSLVVCREALAFYSSLADTAFAMQGLGTFPISHVGTDIQKQTWLPQVVRGDLLAAFAVTEPDAGSDLGAVRTRAERDGALWRLTGLKTFISNAGIAGVYTVLARTSDSPGHDALSMFLVDGEAPGISVRPLEVLAPHPIGELRFDGTPALLLGDEGTGFKTAVATLEHFRPSVGAAACGLAARALVEAVRHTQSRRQFGRPLSDFQAVKAALADMHVDLESARLLVLRAAWLKDQGAASIALEGACAKLAATEMAQRVVDRALQLHGGQGVLKGSTVERLYREVRALRIYEGTSEIQKLVIARRLLKESR
jgi:acyl-CoA dehydrogenase